MISSPPDLPHHSCRQQNWPGSQPAGGSLSPFFQPLSTLVAGEGECWEGGGHQLWDQVHWNISRWVAMLQCCNRNGKIRKGIFFRDKSQRGRVTGRPGDSNPLEKRNQAKGFLFYLCFTNIFFLSLANSWEKRLCQRFPFLSRFSWPWFDWNLFPAYL